MTYSDNYEDAERLRRKKRWKRKRRLKKLRAIAILAFMFLGAVCVLFFAIKGIRTLVSGRSSFVNNDYNEEVPLILDVIYNTPVEAMAEEDIYGTDSQSVAEGGRHGVASTSDDTKGLIVIDAGHGGKDSGAVCDTAYEKDLNLQIAYMLKEELEYRSYEVLLTRSDDTYVELQTRASIANNAVNALCMVSIHQNFCDESTEVDGIEALTYERSGCIEFAELLAACVSAGTESLNRGVTYKTNLVVTSKTVIPSVIIECGYLSNEREAALLQTTDYQFKISCSIADAIEQFVETFY